MSIASGRTTIGWASSALVFTSIVAIAAKIAGVIVAPGARGVGGQSAVTLAETLSGTFAYVLIALLVALVCAASFELARRRAVNAFIRGAVVAVSGLVIALVSPAVVERLRTLPSLALAGATSVITIVAGITVLRRSETRALGGVLSLLSICAVLRVVAWEVSAASFEQASASLYDTARGLATAAVTIQGAAMLLAAAWIGTRSRWRGRILANGAIIAAFAITWVAGRSSDAPSAVEAVLRTSLPAAAGLPAPYLLGSIAAFLVPASILLAAVALVQPAHSPSVVAALALALLSHGAFDVPLQALLATASAGWALLAMSDGDAMGDGDAPPAALERPHGPRLPGEPPASTKGA